MILNRERTDRLHSLILYGSGATLLAGALFGRMEAGAICYGLCWGPSLALRIADRQWRRAILTAALMVFMTGGGLLAIAMDRTTPVSPVWTPGQGTSGQAS